MVTTVDRCMAALYNDHYRQVAALYSDHYKQVAALYGDHYKQVASRETYSIHRASLTTTNAGMCFSVATIEKTRRCLYNAHAD